MSPYDQDAAWERRTPDPCPDCHMLAVALRTDDARCPACAEEEAGS